MTGSGQAGQQQDNKVHGEGDNLIHPEPYTEPNRTGVVEVGFIEVEICLQS